MGHEVTINITPSGKFSTALKEAIESVGMTLAEVAQATDSTYENLRKVVAGHSYPSQGLIRRLAETLGADLDSWETLVEWDKIKKEYGGIPKCVVPSRTLRAFNDVIPKLSPDQRAILLAVAKKMDELSRKAD